MKKIAIGVVILAAVATGALAKGPSYGGGHHSSSHGGFYEGGSGSSHQGGTYRNSNTGDQYGSHK